MFIQLNKNNKIIASANFKFAEDAIEINKEVVRNWDGQLVFKGEETEAIQPTLEELKKEKIKELKNNCKSYIFSVYPIDKQLNIINPLNDYTEEDKQNMNIFINKNRNICNEKKELIKKAKSDEELKKINIDFNKE